MKGIKKTLMAGLFACAMFNNAHADVSPLGFGIKAGVSLSSPLGYGDKAKFTATGNSLGSTFLDTFFGSGSAYLEYAFTDYLGVIGELGYLKQGATLTEQQSGGGQSGTSTTPKEIRLASHTLAFPLSLSVYPMGREEEEGIMKLSLGGTVSLPIVTSCEADGKDLSPADEKELPGFDLAAHVSGGYEFPFGLCLDLKYGFGFMNRLTLEAGKAQTIFKDVDELKAFTLQHLTFTLGYNFASLLSD